jgi:hypothetical protein
MKVSVAKSSPRYVLIMGVTNKTNRGMLIFDTCEDYEAYCAARGPSTMPKHLIFLFDEGKKSRPQLFRTSIRQQRPEQAPPTSDDVTFCEAALTAVARFISEAARLGDDAGASDRPIPESPLNPTQVLSRVVEGGPHMGEFPCTQSIATSLGERAVVVTVIPTVSTMSHLTTGGAVTAKAVTPLSPEFRLCIVCRKTESDIRSTTGHGLKKCAACQSVTERYCSQACQKQDWKRHKLHCNRNL